LRNGQVGKKDDWIQTALEKYCQKARIGEPNGMTARRLVVALSGASGAIYGIRALELARELGIMTDLIISPAAKMTIEKETEFKASEVASLADRFHGFDDIAASIASGSNRTMGMLIVPCSIKTLSAVANSYADNLTARAADVTLKEGRQLVLAVREAPLHLGHLRLMERAVEMGAIVFPPVPSMYCLPSSIDEVIKDTVGRMFQRIGLENTWVSRWEGEAERS
jgi:4-hydroxy-3-polyprenylbenzoate decarboxylase